jgi:hypothetical protein
MTRQRNFDASAINTGLNAITKLILVCLILCACGYILHGSVWLSTKINNVEIIYSGETIQTKIVEGKNNYLVYARPEI